MARLVPPPADVPLDNIAWYQFFTALAKNSTGSEAEAFVTPQMFGALGDGAADDTAAVQSAIDEALSRGVPVRVPQGVYKCTAEITATLSGIQHLGIIGDGSELVEFRFTGAPHGFTFTVESGNWWLNVSPASGLSFRGFTISTENLTTGVGLTVDGGSIVGRPPRGTLFSDVAFRGHASFDTTWLVHTQLINCSSVTFEHCRWYVSGPGEYSGTGVYIDGASGTDPTIINFNNCVHYYGHAWIIATDYVEGIYLTGCTSIGADYAVHWDCGAESGLHVSGGHYSNKVNNFFLDGVFDFAIQGALLYGDPAGGTYYAISILNGSRFAITGNVFVASATATEVGVYVNQSPASAAMGGIIAGNTFCSLYNHAIFLDTTSTRVVVGHNSYNGITSGVSVNDLGAGNTIATLP
jgi:hypothetical protein